jgi:hypothetical protein
VIDAGIEAAVESPNRTDPGGQQHGRHRHAYSTCADTVEDACFVTGALPAPGTVCQQDQLPFAD